jgi:hypothetical protein
MTLSKMKGGMRSDHISNTRVSEKGSEGDHSLLESNEVGTLCSQGTNLILCSLDHGAHSRKPQIPHEAFIWRHVVTS